MRIHSFTGEGMSMYKNAKILQNDGTAVVCENSEAVIYVKEADAEKIAVGMIVRVDFNRYFRWASISRRSVPRLVSLPKRIKNAEIAPISSIALPDAVGLL